MKKIAIISMVLAFGICEAPQGAINCPPSASVCYFKVIYARDVGTGGSTAAERAILHWYIPNHHDYCLYKIENGELTEESMTGFFADNSLLQLAAMAILNVFNNVDGTVLDSSDSMGSDEVSLESISESEYNTRVQNNNSLKDVQFSDSYSLVGFNCVDYADNMFNDDDPGL